MFIESLVFQSCSFQEQSLSGIANDLLLYHGLEIRKQSIDGRFNEELVSTLRQLLDSLIAGFMGGNPPTCLLPAFQRVKVMDSTSYKLPDNMAGRFPGNGGNSGSSSISIQLEYDLKNFDILSVCANSKKVNDHQHAANTIGQVRAGDLLIRDLGYVSQKAMKAVGAKGAFFLNRASPTARLYREREGEWRRICPQDVLKTLKTEGLGCLAMDVGYGARHMGCRAVFLPVPGDKLAARIQRQKDKARQRGTQPDQKILDAQGLNVYITNTTEQQIPASQILALYKLRWQIELVFKAWKQQFEINRVKQAKPCRLEAMVYAQMIGVVLNWAVINAHGARLKGEKPQMVSIQKAFKTLRAASVQFRQAIFHPAKLRKFLGWAKKCLSKNHWVEKRNGVFCSVDAYASMAG